MGKDPFSKPDTALDTWLAAFSGVINVSYAQFGISEPEAMSFAADWQAFHDALLVSTTTATRTPLSIILKDEKRKALVAAGRKLLRRMSVNGLTPYQREQLGLPPRKERGRSPDIDFAPQIDILSMKGHAMELRFHKGLHQGRPEGVAGVTCFYLVGEEPSEDPAAWTFGFATTKTTGTLDFPLSLVPGTKVFVTAFWRNALDESGPAAEAVSSYIGFTASNASQSRALKVAA